MRVGPSQFHDALEFCSPATAAKCELAAFDAIFKELVQEFEAWILEKSIAENGSKRSAAKALGIDIATLVRKTKRKQ